MAPESCDIITAVRQTLRGVADESTRCADHPSVAVSRSGPNGAADHGQKNGVFNEFEDWRDVRQVLR